MSLPSGLRFDSYLCQWPSANGLRPYIHIYPLELDSKNNILPTECSGLPADFTNTATSTSFPVLYGAKVTVSCGTGYSRQSGDTVLQCRNGTSFTYQDKLDCKQGNTAIIGIYTTISNNVIISDFIFHHMLFFPKWIHQLC